MTRSDFAFDPAHSLLLTDLYELAMLQAYYEAGMTAPAVFEFFVRDLPENRAFFMAAGLEQVIEFLEQARFSAAELEWLKASGQFDAAFVDELADFAFSGDVHAMPEGTIFFGDEPILRVTAPLPQAQLVESRIINLLHFESLIATKAARMVLAAPGKNLVDFGLRRAHGAEAGLLAARASYIAGFAGSATTPAGPLYDIPIFGTMAHSFIQAHDDEMAAFEGFARARPRNLILLLDTYDTEAAAEKVVRLAPALARDGIKVSGVRLDSGDLAAHARAVRRILDEGGLSDTNIVVSGGLDEFTITELLSTGAPIDGFGVGTSLTTSSDVPGLDCAYKLQSYAGVPRRKRSEDKATWPGAKQVYRQKDAGGRILGDTITVEGDRQEGEPLVRQYMAGGRRTEPFPDMPTIRDHAAAQLAHLPESCRGMHGNGDYSVRIADALHALAEEADRHLLETTRKAHTGE